jgi:hypothetical protein
MTKFFLARSQKKPTGAVIKRVLVRCPSTGKLTATGQTTNDEAWPKVRFKPPSGNCPHCRRDHSWKKEDVILAR